MYIKFKFHSLVDVITNSSSVIYTNSDGCIEPAKELVQEFLNTMGIDKSVDDMFYFDSFMDPSDYFDYFEDFNKDEIKSSGYQLVNLGYREKKKEIEKIFKKVVSGEIDRPQWMIDAENAESDDWGSYYESDLYISPREQKYEKLAKALKGFLYSTETEVLYNG